MILNIFRASVDKLNACFRVAIFKSFCIAMVIMILSISQANAQTLINGANQTGSLKPNTTNYYTFSASQGDSINLRLGASFYGVLQLYGPDGVLAATARDGTDLGISVNAKTSGIFYVGVSPYFNILNASPYTLHLAQIPEAFTVPAGDEGGPMQNGGRYSGSITLGDLDMWTFTANKGDNINLRMGATFYGQMQLYAPDGTLVATGGDSGDVSIAYTATNSGTFTVVISAYFAGGTGTYMLYLASIPGAFIVPSSDEGGPMVYGGNYAGTITLGDMDLWSFTASKGDKIDLQITPSKFQPYVQLSGPNGSILKGIYGGSADFEIDYTMTNSGTFTVLVSAYISGGTGSYILSLAGISPPAIKTSPASDVGNHSATLNGMTNPHGTSTTVYFQYGTDTTYGGVIGTQSVGNGIGNLDFSANLLGLTTNIIYHFQAVAVGGGATNYGADSTFSTFPTSGQYKYVGCGCNDSAISEPFAGEPIRLGTGNVFEEVADFTTAGTHPFDFTRYYNSLGDPAVAASTLGRNWRSTYDHYLRISPGSVIAERADGQELLFTENNGTWITDGDVDLQLLQAGSTWTLINSDDSIETYTGSSGTAMLSSIQQRDGYTQTMTYSGNQLASVTDSFYRKLQFTYQSNLLHTVTTPSGLILTYGYNSSGITLGVSDRLASVAYSTVPATSESYLYESSALPFALTGIIDENSNRFSTWTYDSSGRATSSQHANGVDLTSVAYNDDGSRNVTNALGLTTVYKFTVLQGVPKVTEIDRLTTASVPAATMTYTYDDNGYIASVSDWNTNATGTVNDVHDQPLVVNEAVGTTIARTTTNAYLANFHLPSKIVAPRETDTFTYDTVGNMLSRTQTDTSASSTPYSTLGRSRTWTNTFDTLGHLLSATGPRTDVTATSFFTYGGSDNLSAITDPLGHVTLLTDYTGAGLPLTMIDANGVKTVFTYDIRNRLLTRTVLAASGNATNSFAYDLAGQLVSIILPDNSFLNFQYDAAHRLQSVTNGLGESVVYTRDPAGNIIRQNILNASASIVKTQSHVFDELSRMLKNIGAASQTTTFGYDGDNNRVFIQDGLTNTTSQAFDALNRLVAMVDPLNQSTSYGYNPADNLTAVTDPRLLTTSYYYDGFGRVIAESSPDKGNTIYQLDESGNRTNQVDARGIFTQRTFDKLNRVTQEIFPASPGENVSYSYDATNGGNFGIGRMTGYTDESGSTALFYNERGDVVRVAHTIKGTPYLTDYAYDPADNITNITYPSGDKVAYTRDSQGRVSSVSFRPSGSGQTSALANNVTYMPFGPLAGLVYGNGLTLTRTFDADYRLTGIATASSGASIQGLGYTYDPVNDIASISDSLAPVNSQTFKYDPDYRLTTGVGNYGTVAYTYDGAGNRRTRTLGGNTDNYQYFSSANQLHSVINSADTLSLTYTANGNLNSEANSSGARTFGYNNRNRYNSLTGGLPLATYEYNAPGERVVKTAYALTTHYHYDQNGHLLAETQPDRALVREYVWLDDMPLAQVDADGSIYFIHSDHLDTPQKMTDSNRNVVFDLEQQPFGEALAPTRPILVAAGLYSDGNFLFNVIATAFNYSVQASDNLSQPDWTTVYSDSSSVSLEDPGTQGTPQEYFRLVYAATNLVTQNLRFPGQYFDAESQLNYNINRDYNPILGRYIQSDPVGLVGGINLFAYVDLNPLRGIDKIGLSSFAYEPLNRIFIKSSPTLQLLPSSNEDDPDYQPSSESLAGTLKGISSAAGKTTVFAVAIGAEPAAAVFGAVTACTGVASYALSGNPEEGSHVVGELFSVTFEKDYEWLTTGLLSSRFISPAY